MEIPNLRSLKSGVVDQDLQQQPGAMPTMKSFRSHLEKCLNA